MPALLLGSGSSAVADTLEQALARVYSANPTLNAQRASTRATDEGVPQALAGYRPRIFASATTGFSRTDTRGGSIGGGGTGVGGSGSRVTTDSLDNTIGASIKQSLFDGFCTKNSVRQAESAILAARETLRKAGTPKTPDELAGFACLSYRADARDEVWELSQGASRRSHRCGEPSVNNGDLLARFSMGVSFTSRARSQRPLGACVRASRLRL